MGYRVIQISEDKMDCLAEHTAKMLRHAGKVMQCIDELQEEHGMGERSGMGMRSGMGGRYGMGERRGMGMREEYEDPYEEEYGMGERRRRRY